MLKFDSTDKVDLNEDYQISDFFHWLPHADDIIVIKKVHAVSKVWGKVEIDLEKIKKNKIFEEETSFPSDYAIEILAQSIGMVGAAQSKCGLMDRASSKEAYVTGLKNFEFSHENICLESGPLFVEIYETRDLENFKFCNVKLYRQASPETEEELLVFGVMNTFSVDM